jgi:hypothetical protein
VVYLLYSRSHSRLALPGPDGRAGDRSERGPAGTAPRADRRPR